ncbi:MAG: aminopeptidase P family protein [Agathobacter sp.]
MSTIPERLSALRAEMKKRNIAIYVVPTADFHESEYVGEYFKARKFITGFTGSAGTAVITMTEAGLWTDARYFLQAEKQLEGSTVTLYKMAEEGVPTVTEYIEKTLKEGEIIGFDGRVINSSLGKKFLAIAEKKNGKLYVDEDLVDLVWTDRPAMSKEPVWIFDEKYVGESVESKLSAVRKKMEEKGATMHLMASLYDIAWLLNVRGRDISYVPVVLSYLALTKDSCVWFVQEEVIDDALTAYLAKNKITTKPYDSFYDFVKGISSDEVVLMNTSVMNYRIVNNIPQNVKVIDAADPSVLLKSIKNPVQMENIRIAHKKDAVAMIKFMYWLKKNVGKIPMTEISVSDYLESLRREQDGCLDLSFDTICGYAEHGAIVHYSATPESDVPLQAKGLLLVDSGGHYLEGTTDITRTFVLGPITEEEKEAFTRVCRSNINLAAARFLYGCSGMNLDIIAREPFWEVGMDYKHGTGHGVGYVLNVHEGPNGFRWRQSPDRSEGATLEEGMVTTDEPGIYIEGKYGVRTENELICRKGEKNEYGQFMYFENVTYVPIDLDAILPEKMTSVERQRLNDYHKMVYDTMAPYFSGEELEFLKEYTRAI